MVTDAEPVSELSIETASEIQPAEIQSIEIVAAGVVAEAPTESNAEDASAVLPDEEAAEDAFVALPIEEAAEDASAVPPVEEVAETPTTQLAGRVVDAMLKTISTAIYSKPSQSERAAFLREMAELMNTAAVGGESPAPSHVEPATAAIAVAVPASPPPRMAEPESIIRLTESAPIVETLVDRIGPSSTLLKSKAEEPDPFAQPTPRFQRAEPKPEETAEADEESGDLALTLLDMMSGGTGSLPHERTLAADTLLRILPRIPVKQLIAVVERVTIMETPPALLVAKLIRDSRHDVVSPLLERCSHISDQDLMNAAPDGDAPKLRMIARRRVLSTVLSDYLITSNDPGVLLTMIRNPGAQISHEAFFRLAEFASQHHALLAPLATRADLPPPVAFELFWDVPPELRRFIFSRFLTDSETLNKILRITLSTHTGENGEAGTDAKFPPKEAVFAALGSAVAYRLDEASAQLAEMAGIARDTALRILSDRDGEPITVLLKALGCTRAKFEEAITLLRQSEAGILKTERDPQELQIIFESLSFNKARILLTYWDWYVRKSGPYAPHN